ncbi:endonuclease/exonuclease/phosphatase family protein [Pararhodobacter zhoushanensis]|uniref:endonuclease/exonuclease/phosphatase family protein n=1 Tax=Pararhodobacter zhoushanensis TaxID=2479545 RepID=UPI000F8DF067|nr:endonuclease/exonuclease/phosphatase family protein [Pararhodobacter zhoushanensis]
MRVLSFNVQNLRLRTPGGAERLDGARDGGAPQDPLDFADRRLTAAVLAQADADFCLLQEVFDRTSLDYFHDHLLRGAGAALWPWRACLPGNDGAGRDLAVLARRPFAAQSHARLLPADLVLQGQAGTRADLPVFSRDCLAVALGGVALYGVHFKAPVADLDAAWTRRRAEALGVRRLIEQRFDDPATALWLVMGDLNDPRTDPERAVAPLLAPFGVDLTERMPETERWTWWQAPRARGCPDAMIASPALAARWPRAVPQAIRIGMSRDAGGTQPRLADVGEARPHASDHAALVLDLPGL